MDDPFIQVKKTDDVFIPEDPDYDPWLDPDYDGGSGGGGGGGGGGWGYGGSGGGGGGGGGGGDKDEHPIWLDGGSEDEDEDGDAPEWIPVTGFAPALTRSANGRLLTNAAGQLLIGENCRPPYLAEVRIDDSDHYRCVLLRCSREIETVKKKDQDDPLRLRLLDYRTGTFTLEIRWQRGHWDYADLNLMDIRIFGISLGKKQVALSDWTMTAKIKITEQGKIYVNSLLAKMKPGE